MVRCQGVQIFMVNVTGLDKQNFQHKVVNIFLPISFNICFG